MRAYALLLSLTLIACGGTSKYHYAFIRLGDLDLKKAEVVELYNATPAAEDWTLTFNERQRSTQTGWEVRRMNDAEVASLEMISRCGQYYVLGHASPLGAISQWGLHTCPGQPLKVFDWPQTR